MMTFILSLFAGVGRFFAAALAWLSKNPAVMIGLVTILAFGMLVISKNHQIADRDAQLVAAAKTKDTMSAALTTERNNTAALKSGLDDANNALGLLQAKATDAQTAYDKIIAGQAAANSRLDGKLANIQSAQPGPDKCASALALIKGQAK